MLIYDNLEDVRNKLNGTLCYYKNKAVMVKESYPAVHAEQNGMLTKEYLAGKGPLEKDFAIVLVDPGGRAKRTVLLTDKEFNYMDFELGYANQNPVAVFWYRQPIRQYRQGLRHEQLGYNVSNKAFKGMMEFGFGRPIADMMENIYPKFSEAVTMLKNQEATIIAFHRNFAISYDEVHNDLILEYKGKLIGHTDANMNWQFMPNFEHLAEALKEAVA